MYRIAEVRPLASYRLFIRFADGVEGELDLSDLVGKGVFAPWIDPEFFGRVGIDPDTHTLAWPGGIDLCPHALHDDLVRMASRAAERG